MDVRKLFRILGPGIVTGAADDDPSGIATYSQTGAQFGYGQLWTMLFMLPMIIAVQGACARIGAVTGHGIAACVKKYYSKKLLYAVVLILSIANIINISADINAMAAALNLLLPVPPIMAAFLFTIIILLLEILVPYKKYVNILKWLSLSLLAYPLSLIIVDISWIEVLTATLIPHIQFTHEFLFIIIGVMGTTISPYLFFWQASQECEELKKEHITKTAGKPNVTKKFMQRVSLDNVIGMVISQITAWSIIVVTASVLHDKGITDIQSAADAAKALEPLVQNFPHAGYIAKFIFSVGIIGLGLIAVPILAGATAYALGETLGWRIGLNLKFKQAQAFYTVIILTTLVGFIINIIDINPIKSLLYAAVINGIVAIPLILVIALIASNPKIMGKYKSNRTSTIFIWLTFLAMTITAVGLLSSFISTM